MADERNVRAGSLRVGYPLEQSRGICSLRIRRGIALALLLLKKESGEQANCSLELFFG